MRFRCQKRRQVKLTVVRKTDFTSTRRDFLFVFILFFPSRPYLVNDELKGKEKKKREPDRDTALKTLVQTVVRFVANLSLYKNTSWGTIQYGLVQIFVAFDVLSCFSTGVNKIANVPKAEKKKFCFELRSFVEKEVEENRRNLVGSSRLSRP